MKKPSDALHRFSAPDFNHSEKKDAFSYARYGVVLGGISILIPQMTGSEITFKPSIQHIPNTPDYFVGVCNIRGNIVPIYDFFIAFNLENTDLDRGRILLFGESDKMTGIVIDQLPQLVQISDQPERIKELQPLPEMLSNHITGGYVIEGINWHELKLTQLIFELSGNQR